MLAVYSALFWHMLSLSLYKLKQVMESKHKVEGFEHLLYVFWWHMDGPDDRQMSINRWSAGGFQDEVKAGSVLQTGSVLHLISLSFCYRLKRASHCHRLTELLHRIWHTTLVNRLLSTAQPSWVGKWRSHTNEVTQEVLVFTTTRLLSLLEIGLKSFVISTLLGSLCDSSR